MTAGTPAPLPPAANRRAWPRTGLRQPAALTLAGQTATVETRDLSRDGLGLLSTRPVTPGRRGTVSFALPLAGGERTISATVRITHSSYQARGAFHVGAAFVDLPADVEAVIRSFLESD